MINKSSVVAQTKEDFQRLFDELYMEALKISRAINPNATYSEVASIQKNLKDLKKKHQAATQLLNKTCSMSSGSNSFDPDDVITRLP